MSFFRSRVTLLAVLLARIGYGAVLVLDPARLTKRWLGPPSEPTEVALRGLGAREIVLHAMALVCALRGGPVRPFLAASMAGDLADIGATVAARRGIPKRAVPATIVVAGASMALSAGVAAGADS
ncbi:MAG: hypothetical protein M3071_09485 [Actinomycetota bacterium]|nr:hypothetical protein [Actinomycetota bacterium]